MFRTKTLNNQTDSYLSILYYTILANRQQPSSMVLWGESVGMATWDAYHVLA